MPVAVYKPAGWTPLEAIDALRTCRVEFRNERIGYAGRLDPMAEGVLLLLVGRENRERRDLLALDKTYRVRVLFGLATDTYDALGLIKQQCSQPTVSDDELAQTIQSLEREFLQDLPPFSAAHVRGRPLYYWTRLLGADATPRIAKVRRVYRARLVSRADCRAGSLLALVEQRVSSVHGDFRQARILAGWRDVLASRSDERFIEALIDIHCSSGTFMRAVANDLGRALGSAAIALEIVRTAVGHFDTDSAVRLC